jgi:hypothetical protein
VAASDWSEIFRFSLAMSDGDGISFNPAGSRPSLTLGKEAASWNPSSRSSTDFSPVARN